MTVSDPFGNGIKPPDDLVVSIVWLRVLGASAAPVAGIHRHQAFPRIGADPKRRGGHNRAA